MPSGFASSSCCALAAAAALVGGAAAAGDPSRRAHKVWFGKQHGASRKRPSSSREKDATTAARLKAGFGGNWPQEHFDVRNSGSSIYNGPGDTQGFCRASLTHQDPTAPGSTSYSSTGVTTLSDNSGYFTGGSDNKLLIAQIYSLDQTTQWSVDLNKFNSRTPLAPYGIVASGATWGYDIGDSTSLASADGNVYTVWWLSCVAQAQAYAAMPEHFAMHPHDAERAALEPVEPAPALDGRTFDRAHGAAVFRVNHAAAHAAMFVSPGAAANVSAWVLREDTTVLGRAHARARAAGRPSNLTAPFPSCLQWTAQLGNPSYSPPRYMSYIPGAPGTFVMASETDPNLDTGGVVHVFDSATGAEVWNFKTLDGSGKWWGVKGTVPAIDEQGMSDGAVFLAFGPRVVALAPNNGSVLALLDFSGSSDPFVASPVLDLMGQQLYLHSASGTLWKVAVTGGYPDPLTLTLAWGCDYVVTGSGANATLSDCQAPPAVFNKALTSAVFDTETGTRVVGWRSILRRDYVPGGWYQPTTAAQRDELYDAILGAHAAHTGQPTYASPEARKAAVAALQPEDVAALAKALPHTVLHGIRTASGYVRLGPNGKPAPVVNARTGGPAWAGTLPLATPAIDESLFNLDDSLILPQFLPPGQGNEGMFVVRADTGGVLWGFNKWTTTEGYVVPFGRSRSSPAVDGDDYVYVGADIDHPLMPGSSLPVLFAFEGVMGSLVWATTMGFEPNITVGSASPMVVDGYNDGNYAIMSASDGVVQIGEGAACPTDDEALECSGHGECDCTVGACSCDAVSCFGGPACTDQCANGGSCSAVLDQCTCLPNYDVASQCVQCDACHVGPDSGCTQVANFCSLHGTCVVAAPGGAGVCQCDPGWGGMGCTEPAAGYISAQTAINVGAAVGVPVVLVAVAAAGLLFWKRTHPGSTFADLLPRQLLGGGEGAGFASSSDTAIPDGAVVTQSALFSTPGKEGTKLLGKKTYGAL